LINGFGMKTTVLHTSIHFMELKSALSIFTQIKMGRMISQRGGKKSGKFDLRLLLLMMLPQ